MQKGHRPSTVPILLILLVAIAVMACATGTLAQQKYLGRMTAFDVGGLIPINGLRSSNPATRPVFGHVLPTPPIYMQSASKQGSGPNPDDNLTSLARTSFELQPNASPGVTQNRIVFSSNGIDSNLDGRIDSIPDTDADYDLWIMRSDGSEQYRLMDLPGDQIEPCYDPSGRMVVFSQKVNNTWQVFSVEIRDPSVVKQITTGPGNKRHPTWSPDFNWICFQSDVNGNWDLYRILATGQGSPIQITTGPTNDTDPSWAPAGLRIAFTREANGIKRIYTTRYDDGSDLEQITDGGGVPTCNDKDPAWVPDTTRAAEIVFASDRPVVGQDTANFNIYRVGGTGEVLGNDAVIVSNRLAGDTADDTDPTWTWDIDRAPSRIAFSSTRAGNADVWAMQLSDWRPPLLQALPTVTPRLASPGGEVTISAQVYDKDSPVQRVMAYIKTPDIKMRNLTYDDFHPITGEYQGFIESDGWNFDTSYAGGHRAIEMGCAYQGQVELLDDDGDGVFTGTWDTQPIAAGRDYIIDIFVLDEQNNSVTFDDVYGFSTRTFSPRNNLLFVDDYCEGQRFISQLGWNNDITAAYPCESYYTYSPGTHPSVDATVEKDSILGAYETGYDTWRIICRGPVPTAILGYYLPTVEYQLDPNALGEAGGADATADRAVPVADRGVIWASPKTGNLWTADGTLIDASTQSSLTTFIQRGGRLFLSGEDIAWALTMNGTLQNSFLANTLNARFGQDCAYPHWDIQFFDQPTGLVWQVQNATAEFGVQGLAGDPVAFDPWVGAERMHAADRFANFDNWYDNDDNPMQFTTPRFPAYPTTPWFSDANWFSVRPDTIEVLGNAVKIYGIGDNENITSFAGPAVGLRWQDTGGMGGRLVFLSFGFEQIHRGYHTPSNIPPHCRNLRSHLLHNAMCWMRTGGLQGIVVNIDGSGPLNDPAPIVTFTQRAAGGQISNQYAVRCQQDGTYICQGMAPGQYDISATRPGFEIDHYDSEYVHGGQLARVKDIAIKRAQPGAVSGKVIAASDDRPLANVTVSVAPDPDAVPVPSAVGLPAPVLTAADGTYTLPYIPAGGYVIKADGTVILYGTEETPATINPGDTTIVDFALEAADGTLLVRVNDVDEPTLKLRNAQVSVTDATNHRTMAYTDDTGSASLPLAPGAYTLTVSAPGYQASAAQSFVIEPAVTETISVSLQKQPGGAILGRVVSATSGAFVSDVTVRVLFGQEEIASTQTSGIALVTQDGVQYNFQIADVPTGEVTVVVSRTGFTAEPSSRTVVIASGVTTTGVNFAMNSLFTFPRGLQLVSLPWDYSSTDAATLLGITSPGNLSMATWEAARQRYRLYPDAPADRFRLGCGYWLNLSSPADLTTEGSPAVDPVEIPLSAGWNLIGCPYQGRIDFYTSQVRDADGVVYSLQQALSRGIIGSGLYSYVLGGYQTLGVMSQYTGYWLKAYQPCYLIVSAKVGTLAAGETRDATPKAEGGWLLSLKTSCAGLEDSSTFLGTARGATDGCDFGLDQAKPPVPGMGGYIYTAIDNRNWGQAAGDYAVDMRAVGQKSSWDLNVSTNQVGQKVRLTWGDLSALPNDVRPVLLDLDSGKSAYLRTCSTYEFTAAQASRRLRIVVEPSGTGALTISPLAASSTAKGTAISYTLSQAASVEVTISNIAGRIVRQAVTNQVQPAGQNTIFWDGRDRNGLSTPNGRYLVSIVGRTDNGQQARTIMPLQKVAH